MMFTWKAKEEALYYIRVHLTLKQPIDGCCGESLWAFVDQTGYNIYCGDTDGKTFWALLDNDSVIYRELTHGTIVSLTSQGKNIPEITIDPTWEVIP